ncbi:hypothetical protein N431DRAFT_393769 [Stipitochalara longipes BDJ]|nr:hypothetical protein N431DRAFT_393769 [Stipitochalara longipes BDJ]
MSIALKLDGLSSKRLDDLRAQCFIPSRALARRHDPVEYIILMHRLPASKRPLFEEILVSLASIRQSYQLAIGRPFITKGISHPSVSFDIESQETLQIHKKLSKSFKEVPPIQLSPYYERKFRPKFTVDSKLTLEEAEQTLEKSLQRYKEGIESVTGIGLAFRLHPPFRRGQRKYDPAFMFADWTVFPFPRLTTHCS